MKILLLAAAVALSTGLALCTSPGNKGHLASLLEEMKGLVQGEVIPLLKTFISLYNTTIQNNRSPSHCRGSLDPRDSRSGLQDVSRTTDEDTAAQNNSLAHHCKDLLDSGDSGKGLRDVFPDPDRPHHSVEVYCDHITDGGGWTVFQRRTDDGTRESFERSWNDYKEGFGDKEGEFWLGLDTLHQLTSRGDQQLRVDLEDYDGGHRWAKYGLFHVGSQDTNYTLIVSRYSGNAGDALVFNNGHEFSTNDSDHDTHTWAPTNCADQLRGGWWYGDCGHANLNGFQHVGEYFGHRSDGIRWDQWRGRWYSLRRATMMVRPAL